LPFPLLFLDIDHFTSLVNRYGYLAGEMTLQTVSRLLCREMHSKDTIIRWNEDQFILILNNLVKGSHLYDVANRLSFLVKDATITFQNQLIQITVSIGATLSWPDDSVDSLIYRAKQLMHSSKEKGDGGDIRIDPVAIAPEGGNGSTIYFQ
jgi:diguanylate cyclase (GGDEF)-like protein